MRWDQRVSWTESFQSSTSYYFYCYLHYSPGLNRKLYANFRYHGMHGIFAKRYPDVNFERTYIRWLSKAREGNPIFATIVIGCVFGSSDLFLEEHSWSRLLLQVDHLSRQEHRAVLHQIKLLTGRLDKTWIDLLWKTKVSTIILIKDVHTYMTANCRYLSKAEFTLHQRKSCWNVYSIY